MSAHHDEGRFDRWAPHYDRSIMQRLMFGPVHDAVLEALDATGPAPRELLDIGCGTGRLLEQAGRRWSGARLTGIDASAAMIVEARRKHEGDARFDFRTADAAALPLEPASVDAACSTISFHHWYDQAGGLREIARVLRPGGRFVLADIDVPFLFLCRPLLDRFDHAGFHEPAAVRRLLERAGLAAVLCRRLRLRLAQLHVARRETPPAARG